MDVLRFINSNALRDYLKEINYDFNGFEAAYLVWNCRTATLEEKHAAWREIIETYPDEKYKNRQPNDSREPLYLHATVKAYMEYERRLVDFIKKDHEPGTYVYQYKYREIRDGESYDDDGIYSSFYLVLADVLQTMSELEEDAGDAQIFKRPVDGNKTYAEMTVNKNGEILRVVSHEIHLSGDDYFISDYFESMWFGFPVPFNKGDILYDPERSDPHDLWSSPFVYTECAIDLSKEYGRPLHDYTDMTAYGYFLNGCDTLYGDCVHDYTSLEYYPEEKLTGFLRVLIGLSNLIKGDIEGTLFAKAYAYILADERAKLLKPRFLTEKGMRLAGLGGKEGELG